ncbi:hypothetical protein ACIRON_16680 [Nocardioides sp. NPDC101246]|uniref:hypothetical protein n=1 Tax=Nocardioides sp. NPDC101246 TaxID=3364336 RepID=UPI00382361E9
MRRITMPAAPVAAVMALAVLGLCVLVWQASAWRTAQRDDDRRAAAVETAEAQVLDLTTMDPKTVKKTMNSLTGRLSGDFKRQFNGFSSNFVTAVTEDKITAKGKIKGSAISKFDGDKATVLVASAADVGRGGQETVARGWRFSVDLERSGDDWLISGMEFVQ